MNKIFQIIIGIIFLIILIFASCSTIYIGYLLVNYTWKNFAALPATTSTSIIAAMATVMAATLTVVLGKYYERKKEIEAHHRNKKIEIYDEFLIELFKLFQNNENTSDVDLVSFMRDWNRKVILWGGQEVFTKYMSWMEIMQQEKITIKAFYLMEDFFREIRKDIGHSSNKIPKGEFIKLILKRTDILFELEQRNPNATIEEVVQLEKIKDMEINPNFITK